MQVQRVKRVSRSPGGHRPAPYLVRQDRAGSHLCNGQGLLQLGASHGAVGSPGALPGSPGKGNKDDLLGVALWGTPGHGKSCTCRAKTE